MLYVASNVYKLCFYNTSTDYKHCDDHSFSGNEEGIQKEDALKNSNALKWTCKEQPGLKLDTYDN